MFRAHTPIIRSIRCWVAAYGFLHCKEWDNMKCVSAQTSSPHTNRPAQYSIDRTDNRLYNTSYSHYTHTHTHTHFILAHSFYSAENHMLQLNIQCSWWWAYVPETCRAKNTSIKLPSCIKLAFHLISYSFSIKKTEPYERSNKFTMIPII